MNTKAAWLGAMAGAAALWTGCAEPETEGRDWRQIEQEARVCADGPTVPGIDVSKWQGDVNWRAVADDGIKYAIVRVSDGTGYRDEYFDANWRETRENGILRGVYQFFRPGQDAIAQADLLVDRMGELQPGDLPPVIDVEDTDDQSRAVVVDKIRQWIQRVEGRTGVRPMIYTGKYFWQDNVATTEFNSYPLWVAQYTDNPCPDLPSQWDDWTFWQTSSTGRVDGVSGNVDTNLFNGDINALRAFTVGDPVCGDGVCHPSENHDSCAGDCPVCENVPPDGRIIDEADLCFTGGGDPRWLRNVEGGWDGHLIWTHATDSANVANYGLWSLTFDEPGDYKVEVYIDPAWAESRQCDYQVTHAGTTDVVVIDQAASDGWVDLGTFPFSAGAAQSLRLDDNTGEPLDGQLQIVFDAIRLTRVRPPEPDNNSSNNANNDPNNNNTPNNNANNDPNNNSGDPNNTNNDPNNSAANNDPNNNTNNSSGDPNNSDPNNGGSPDNNDNNDDLNNADDDNNGDPDKDPDDDSAKGDNNAQQAQVKAACAAVAPAAPPPLSPWALLGLGLLALARRPRREP
jgi:GH25 family lysozyme M1 (1,4-beta-N-acetylmuramidase)